MAVRVDDIAPNGYGARPTNRPPEEDWRRVRFELAKQTRQAIDEYLRLSGRKRGEFVFAGRGEDGHGLTTRQYARLVGHWIASINLRSSPSLETVNTRHKRTLGFTRLWSASGWLI